MTFLQALAIALVPTVGIGLTVWASTRDLALRRKLEGIDKFFEIIMVANARAIDRPSVGSAEQVAGIQLLASFGGSEKHLRLAARAALEELMIAYSQPNANEVTARVREQVEIARRRLD